MAKLSKQTKEIIKTVLFFLVAGLLLFFYVIYPLNKTETMFARPDIDEFDQDSLLMNDPAFYIEQGFIVDSFRLEADGLTQLAVLNLNDSLEDKTPEIGSVIILHADNSTRDSVAELAKQLMPHSNNIIVYDQRASGLSTNRYYGLGEFEATDLVALISNLDLRGSLVHPLVVIGFEIGADAALMATLEESRIDWVLAIDPYLTTDRLMEGYHKKFESYWFPFYKGTFFWWYERRSSYAPTYFELNDLTVAPVEKTLFINEAGKDDEAVVGYSGMSSQINLITYSSDEDIEDLIVLQLTRK